MNKEILTNLGKTKAEIILELLISLNQSGTGSTLDASAQYEVLVEKGIIIESTGIANFMRKTTK